MENFEPARALKENVCSGTGVRCLVFFQVSFRLVKGAHASTFVRLYVHLFCFPNLYFKLLLRKLNGRFLPLNG